MDRQRRLEHALLQPGDCLLYDLGRLCCKHVGTIGKDKFVSGVKQPLHTNTEYWNDLKTSKIGKQPKTAGPRPGKKQEMSCQSTARLRSRLAAHDACKHLWLRQHTNDLYQQAGVAWHVQDVRVEEALLGVRRACTTDQGANIGQD